MDGCAAVAHLAIMNDFHGMYADRRAAEDGYVGLTRRVVDAANRTGARVGYVSSDWVFDGTGHLVDEEEPPNPVNFYGFLKAASELVVLERADAGFVARVGGVQGVHQTQASGPRSQDVGFGYFVLSLVDALRAGRRFTVWEDPAINSVATPIVAPEIGALLGLAVARELDGVLHLAGGTVVTRRELALATCSVFGLDAGQLDFGPPPDEARLPAPVPYDTSMACDATMNRLGAQAHPIEEQLRALRTELELGAPAPMSGGLACDAP
jgi:dTDP-4-dehydrorhamnose reductase